MIDYLKLAMSLADKVLGILPDYEEKKKKEFYKLKEQYERQIKKPYYQRDDLIVDQSRDELRLFIQRLIEEI